MSSETKPGAGIPFWRDIRFWQIFLQIAFIIVVFLFFRSIINNIWSELGARGQTPTFSFLGNRAGFGIGGAENYSPDDSFFAAFMVGVRNTLRVVTLGLVLATLLGVMFGIFLLSGNWLLRTLSRIYVEILRNTPLLVQLFVWYFVAILGLPAVNDAIELPLGGVLSISLRWIIYAIIGFFIVLWASRQSNKPRRNAVIAGALAAASIIEIGFWQFRRLQILDTEASIALAEQLYGGASLQYPWLWVYLVVSMVLAGVAWSVIKQENIRFTVVGLLLGQLLGGLLFYFGTVPATTWRYDTVLMSMSLRGIVLPEITPTPRFAQWIAFVLLGVLLAVGQWVWLGRITENTGKPFPRFNYALLAIIGFAILGWVVVQTGPAPLTYPALNDDGTIEQIPVEEARAEGLIAPEEAAFYSEQPLLFRPPVRQGLRFATGTELSPEFAAVLLGLVIYTSAFIAEIVRAGIQAVPDGQREAAAAIGLRQSETLQMIILPQALRVIIPPMGNQYLNLAKNSSLAIVASYSDIFQVMNTVINQSGQSVSGIVLIMVSYLIISLVISFVMNVVNQRFQLVTR